MSYLASPFNALNQINRELNRFFDDRPPGRLVDSANRAPQVDISENEDAFLVSADMPGVKPEDMEISLHQGVLTIKGKRSTSGEVNESGFTRRERIRGTFYRQFNLPATADEETVSARLNQGVLEITIPKGRKARPISITVEGDG